jgi:hypothetical protein
MNEKISNQDFVIPPIPPKLEKKAEVLPKDATFSGITEKSTHRNGMLAAQRVLHQLDHQPLTEIVKMLKDSEELPPKLRAEINLKLLDFVYPRLKAVSMEINETSGDIVKETLNEMNRKSVGFDFIKRNKTTFVEEE